jgi:hypothetical protein
MIDEIKFLPLKSTLDPIFTCEAGTIGFFVNVGAPDVIRMKITETAN